MSNDDKDYTNDCTAKDFINNFTNYIGNLNMPKKNKVYKAEDFIDWIKEPDNTSYRYDMAAIIFADGTMSYAYPSHLTAIYGYIGITEEVFSVENPNIISPLLYLMEKYCITTIDNNYIIVPINYTKEQILTIQKLQNANLIYSCPKLDITNEKSYFDINGQGSASEYEQLYRDKIKATEKLRELLGSN